VVLGEGSVRLHDQIDTAVGRHRLALPTSTPAGWESVSEFPAEDGSVQHLVRRLRDGPDDPSLGEASLEELVIGYLAVRYQAEMTGGHAA
jgi:hypothetical protein